MGDERRQRAEGRRRIVRRFPPKSLLADSGEIPDFFRKVGDLGW
jgi:hypothetical protein